jgi:hypothetical protein
MKLTLGRLFGQHGAEMAVIDPGIETFGRSRSTSSSASSASVAPNCRSALHSVSIGPLILTVIIECSAWAVMRRVGA